MLCLCRRCERSWAQGLYIIYPAEEATLRPRSPDFEVKGGEISGTRLGGTLSPGFGPHRITDVKESENTLQSLAGFQPTDFTTQVIDITVIPSAFAVRFEGR